MKHTDDPSRRLFDWLFRTADGAIVIAQFPNWPLWTWLLATLLESLVSIEPWRSAFYWIGTAALIWWSYLEIAEGVNGFRRILGTLVLIFVFASRAQAP